MVELLTEGTIKARNHHRCYDCAGWITPGEIYHQQICVNDGSAYRIRQHSDCRAMSDAVVASGYRLDYDDGIPPLHENDEATQCLDAWRGHYPHVVCRIEYRQQVQDLLRQNRSAE